MSHIALATCASSGFCRTIANGLAANGHMVYASMRDIAGRNARSVADLRAKITHRMADMLVEYFSEAARPHTMVLIEEAKNGGYGRADEIFVVSEAYRAKDN